MLILFAAHLEELEQLLKGIAVMKELTPRTRDYLVSFGECLSTRIFAAYLNKIGIKARQVCQLESLATCHTAILDLLSVASLDYFLSANYVTKYSFAV